MKLKTYARMAICISFVLGVTVQANGAEMVSEEMMLQLKRMIEKQQAQLDKQAAEIAYLQQQLGTKVDSAEVQNVVAAAKEADDKTTESSFSNVNLSLYGHVNQALLWSDNGNTSETYIVDNINSQTRLGLKAKVDTTSDWTVGGRIEYGIVSNASSDVNHLTPNGATSNNFKLRWAEISFQNDNIGKISLGKGDSASNGSAEVDLSGTALAAYSGYTDIGGSLLWYDSATGIDPTFEVGDVFSNFDGLSRTDRIRYDTPSFGGFSLAVSYSSGSAVDGAVNFNRKFGETKVAASVAAADPGDLRGGVKTQYSGSASILFPMGLNFTMAAGTRDLESSTQDDPTNWYGKIGYKTQFYDAATTALSIDYGQTSDLNTDGDEADTWALAAVHNVKDWGTEFYVQFRQYMLDSMVDDYDDISTFLAGARIKF